MSVVLLASGEAGRTAELPPARPFRLCALDQAMILQRSKLAANMATRFQQVRQQAQAKFQDTSRTLDADARALESLRASLPPAVVKAKSEEIVRRRSALKGSGDQVNRDLAALDSELTANVTKLAEPTVRQIENERGCSMLIASNTLLHLNDASLDITAAVIERMNARASLATPPGR